MVNSQLSILLECDTRNASASFVVCYKRILYTQKLLFAIITFVYSYKDYRGNLSASRSDRIGLT